MEAAAKVLQCDLKGREAIAIVERMIDASRSSLPTTAKTASVIIVVEGLDGTGKSTLIQNLTDDQKKTLGQAVQGLKSPPDELLHLRAHFDRQPKEVRRAYYSLGNYACAARMKSSVHQGPLVIDRFWPSTVAYALAHDLKAMPDQQPDLLNMPEDLLKLLPTEVPIVCLLLDLPEAERARRVRARAAEMPAGMTLSVTREEEELEQSKAHRERLRAAYGALKIAGQPLAMCDATGTEEQVLQRALEIVCKAREEKPKFIPRSVNWHFTRQCNYSCKFCFHTATSSFFLPKTPEGMQESKQCLRQLRDAGMKKINFSGGEPFLQAKELGELCRFCKEELGLESVTIISNGSLIKEHWFESFGRYVDILAVSCDSFNEETNKFIGRGKGVHIKHLQQVRSWCTQYGVPFKLNSVINIHNFEEDMNEQIAQLNPVRWKVFQCLLLAGENAGEGALRDARALVITSDQFNSFLNRHSSLECLVPEDNAKMRDSYLILDEELRFLNCTDGGKVPSESLRYVSVARALQQAGFDDEMFEKRGGVYNWSRSVQEPKVDIEDLAAHSETQKDEKASKENFVLNMSKHMDDQTWHMKSVVAVGIALFVCMLMRQTHKAKAS